MKINNKLLILLSIVLLLVGGCTNGENGDVRTGGVGSGSSTDSPTSGVQLDFADGNPSSEIFKGESTNFAFVFRNHLEHEVNDLQVRIGGFDRGFVTGLDESYSVNSISRATEAAGFGVYSGLVVENVVIDDFSSSSYNFDPRFRYCYTARSVHQESICVPDSNNRCDTDVNQEGYANGPVTVSVDSINSLDDRVLVRFSVQNRGDGQVVNNCFETDDFSIEYDVEANLGTQTGSCSPIGADNFFLRGGESGNFQCEFSRTSQDSYSSQVNVELEYNYQQQTQKDIQVIDLQN